VSLDYLGEWLADGTQVCRQDGEGGVAELASQEDTGRVGFTVPHSHRVVADLAHPSKDRLAEETEGEIARGDGIASIEQESLWALGLQLGKLARGRRRETVVQVGGMEKDEAGRRFTK
jgi:hypothetical protein